MTESRWLSMIGASLRGLRAGTHGLTSEAEWVQRIARDIVVSSPAFGSGRDIPERNTADGAGLSPELEWRGVPAGTVSLALMVEDPDIPLPIPFTHALAYGLPPGRASLDEGALPSTARGPSADGFRMGRNGIGRAGWLAPRPPPGHGPHHYAFQVFALDKSLTFDAPPGRHALRQAMRGHVVGWGVLFGVYERV